MAGVQPNTTLQESFEQAAQHHEAGRHAAAEAIYRRLLVEHPDNAEVHYNFGVVLAGQGKFDEAVAAYQKALALRPGFLPAGINLGNLLHQGNQPAQAAEVFLRTLAQTREDYAMVYNNLAAALRDTGRLNEALACFSQAMAILPTSPATASNRLCSLHFHPGFDAVAIFREARQWNERFARPLSGEIPIHDNDPSPTRRLRIGYVSPDFRQNVVALYTIQLLARHDHRQFEIFCYSNVRNPDAATARLRHHADAWRDIHGLSDEATAQLIRNDKIDILVDLAMHAVGNRLLVFARKPAPIQVTWLGYPGTTGLDAMDYRLTDPQLDPPASGDVAKENDAADQPSDRRIGIQHAIYAERSVYLPDCFWCYDPSGLDEMDGTNMLQPGPVPALAAGQITFGCLNNFCKINDPLLALWGRVMAAVPDSRLLLMAAPGPHRQRIAQKLGVSGERVRFVPYQSRKQYLETYRWIDLCLDTLPYNGHTTTLDALWMGVPVVTLVGRTIVGRGGWSLFHNLGMMELVAWTDEQFVQAAVEWAGDLDRLSRLRVTLRERLRQSKLMDGARFARGVEVAYRQMWQAWCKHRR